ncbi:MAG: AbrB/MazE/SpoVT family DNA-binding domain-containing protein [Micrococcales bacterium]|nr:AbrB/MazE/SpoVT family DNA-binding domain-containing protein [Micrococcales bacterium]
MATNPTSPGSFPWQHLPRPGRIYGAATVSERGQISLPADARRELGIEAGDKLMVFGNKVNDSVVLIKADVFEKFADFFMAKLNKLGTSTQSFMEAFTAAADQEAADQTSGEDEPKAPGDANVDSSA